MKQHNGYEKDIGHWVHYREIFWAEGSDWYHPKSTWYRRVRTTNEKRAYAIAVEQEVPVRGRRRANHLPCAWDDQWVPSGKSWKRSHRCKKQYMKNLKD